MSWAALGWADVTRRAFVPAVAAAGGRVVAVATRSGDPAEIGRHLPNARVYGGLDAYDEALHDDDVDAVYVALPNHLHAGVTEAAADHGKHVLCEKPLATTAAEADAMASACERAGVVLMEAMMARFNPQHRRVGELIASGAIGEAKLFRASFTVRLADPELDIRFLPASGSGAIFDLGVYPICAARWVFGADPLKAVATRAEFFDTGADEVAGILLRFPEGRLGVIDCGLTVEPRNRYEVVGTKGTIAVERPFASPPFVRAEPSLELTISRADDVIVERFDDRSQYERQLDAFHRMLIDGEPHPYPPRESLSVAQAIDQVRASDPIPSPQAG